MSSPSSDSKPTVRPRCPNFSSGPCAKRPGWSLAALPTESLGRSHRSKLGKGRIKKVIDDTKALLELPADYRVGLMAGSDTGAFEAAMWSLLGPRPVDVFAWESFSKGWVTDITKQLKLPNTRSFVAPYGELPDLTQADFTHDVVFTWNGTTSGVCVPNGDWIPDTREGLTLCDATSGVLGMPIPWAKCDVITYSWQKCLGGEGAHGILILSPRAVERLESYKPTWPMPKLFRMTKEGKVVEGIFAGETINTPSLLCVEDVLDAMAWAQSVGGQKGTIARTRANFAAVEAWVKRTPWIDFLARDPASRSPTSVCLKIVDPAFLDLSSEDQLGFCKKLVARIEAEGAGYDFNGYRDAPAGLRIWCGATAEASDIAALTAWIDWSYAEGASTLRKAA